ncbi:MAG: hypothetical protein H6713_29885 [Myxococcales bacterium]|nr:hypothetical protein [Myxococcales bacterium]
MYILATLAFAARVYFARAAAVGACVGALAQQWPHLRFGLERADIWTLGVLPLAAIALLASSDLVRRFERDASRHRWLTNHWAPYTDRQTRTIRWSIYTAGALGGLLDHILQLSSRVAVDFVPAWPRVAMIAIVICAALLVLGRAIGLVGLWLTCVTVAVLITPHAVAVERWFFTGAPLPEHARALGGAWHYLSPALLLALLTAITATPFVLRLLGRVLVSAPEGERAPGGA